MTGGRGTAMVLAAVFAAACGRAATDVPAPPAARQTTSAGPVGVRLSIDRDRITTAERVHLSVELTIDAGAVAELPELPESWGGFTIVERRRSPPALSADGALRLSAAYTLEPFLPGSYEVPSLEFPWTDATGRAAVLRTSPIGVEVESVLAAGEQAGVGEPRGVVAPAESTSGSAVAWAVGGAFIFIAGAAYWWLRRRKRPPEDAWARAEARLARVQGSLADSGGADRAVEEAASVLRGALAASLDPDAARRTTEELLAEPALARTLPRDRLDALGEALRTADRVKFAAAPATLEQAHAAVGAALGVIRAVRAVRAAGGGGGGPAP